MTEVPEELIGWPPYFRPPLRYGTVDGIAWAIQEGGTRGMRTINGYARIPWEGHPWSGITDYDQIADQLSVHGGLTFGPHPMFDVNAFAEATNELMNELGKQPMTPLPEPPSPLPPVPATSFADVGGWIGFDTGHAWDAWTVEELARWGIEQEQLGISVPMFVDASTIWWTGEAVIAEAKNLAAQIAAAANQPRTRSRGR